MSCPKSPQLQLLSLKRILEVTNSIPIAALFLELGIYEFNLKLTKARETPNFYFLNDYRGEMQMILSNNYIRLWLSITMETTCRTVFLNYERNRTNPY